MSETIQGSKSINYNKTEVNGINNSGDNMQHLTIQEVSGKRGAADVMIHGTTLVSSGHTIEAGSAQRLIKSTAHGAKQGWIMRPSDGNSASEEIAIIKIVDVDNFTISTLFDMAIGNSFDLLKSVTPNYTADGDLNVVVSGSGPVQFVLDGVNTEVEEDTAVPANSNPLPVKVLDPSGVGIDFSTETTLSEINVKTPDLGQALEAASSPVVLPASQITALTPPAAITGFALETTQAAGNVLIGSVTETAPATDTASSGLNGRLQRIAQRITSLIALLPTALGQGTMAQSLKVVLPSDQSAIPTTNTQQSVAGTITQAQVSVGLTAVRATVAGTAPSTTRKKLIITPSKANTGAIYLGSSSVTTANGKEIIGPDTLIFDFDSGDYYLISDTAAQSVAIVEKV